MLEVDNRHHPGIVRDPRNGFVEFFRSERGGITHSLVFVPAGEEFRVDYTKPSSEVDLTMRVFSSANWIVEGTMDPYTFAEFGFKIEQQRSESTPPIITCNDVRSAQRFGENE